MKSQHPILIALFLFFAGTALTNAQSKKPRFSTKDLEKRFEELEKKAPKEARDKLPDNDQLRKAFDAVDEALKGKLDKQLDEEAKRMAEGAPSNSDEARARSDALMKRAKEFAPDAVKRIEDSEIANRLKNKALPKEPEVSEEARELANVSFVVAGGGSIKLPDLAKVSWDGSRTPIEGHGPAPGRPPLTLAELNAKKKKNLEEINITSTGGAIFAQTPGEIGRSNIGKTPGPIAIFEENVFVDHPEFKIECDEFTVYLRPDADGEGKEGAAPPANVEDKSILRAIATGREVKVQRLLGDKLEIGKAKRLVYNGDNGDVILIGQAQVQKEDNLLEGEEIVLPKEGAARLTKGAKLNILRVRK